MELFMFNNYDIPRYMKLLWFSNRLSCTTLYQIMLKYVHLVAILYVYMCNVSYHYNYVKLLY